MPRRTLPAAVTTVGFPTKMGKHKVRVTVIDADMRTGDAVPRSTASPIHPRAMVVAAVFSAGATLSTRRAAVEVRSIRTGVSYPRAACATAYLIRE